ncbi:MAG: pyridoxal phosphate-dependent aminotransferase [Desulfobacterales bacterium]|jgi:aspartate aminotransferase|nr:pyridoxal phosphate-dependent aminotransferase [Desulfobacterales bacterium]
MAVSKKIESILTRSSWIRKMFEEGTRLKALYGDDKVFDFSLGNPNLPPPAVFNDTLVGIVKDLAPGSHGYMPNAGYPFVRKAMADMLSREHGRSVSENDVIMTCGAAGGLNVIFKTILNPGEEVLSPAPYFVEYHFYADNHGGELKTVPTNADFTLNLTALSAAVTEKTRAVLINSPNNPTGQIYSEESLAALGRLLADKSRDYGKTIYLISDEPYRKIVFDGAVVPSIWAAYSESLIVTSFSKDISVPGERIGYIAVGPDVTDKEALLGGMALANRILGFVNAPALMQRVVAAVQGATVDVGAYARKRDLLCKGLAGAGYEFIIPPGAFYLFPKSPIADDVAFVRALQEERILVVPGSGFGGPGHFRIAFCVEDTTIIHALPGFKKVMANFK